MLKPHSIFCRKCSNKRPMTCFFFSSDKIEEFIDENKALIKRMYGSFMTPVGNRVRRSPSGVPDLHEGDSYFRHVRQATNTALPDPQSVNNTGRFVLCSFVFLLRSVPRGKWGKNGTPLLRITSYLINLKFGIVMEIWQYDNLVLRDILVIQPFIRRKKFFNG